MSNGSEVSKCLPRNILEEDSLRALLAEWCAAHVGRGFLLCAVYAFTMLNATWRCGDAPDTVGIEGGVGVDDS